MKWLQTNLFFGFWKERALDFNRQWKKAKPQRLCSKGKRRGGGGEAKRTMGAKLTEDSQGEEIRGKKRCG